MKANITVNGRMSESMRYYSSLPNYGTYVDKSKYLWYVLHQIKGGKNLFFEICYELEKYHNIRYEYIQGILDSLVSFDILEESLISEEEIKQSYLYKENNYSWMFANYNMYSYKITKYGEKFYFDLNVKHEY